MTDISIIIPAYNESLRIVPFLRELAGHCAGSSMKYEIVVVDDGSRDDTAKIVSDWAKSYGFIRLLRHPINRGKGAAVRTGILASSGRYRLFMDADGSFDPSDIEPRLHWFDAGYDAVIGSRFIREEGRPVVETWHHRIMRAVLNGLSRALLGFDVRDSQCGFKMFTANAAQRLFTNSRMDDFSFDLEILSLLSRSRMRLREVRVSCVVKKGSKVSILNDTLRLFISIFRIRFFIKYDPSLGPSLQPPAAAGKQT